MLEVLASAVRQERETESMQIGKKEKILSRDGFCSEALKCLATSTTLSYHIKDNVWENL